MGGYNTSDTAVKDKKNNLEHRINYITVATVTAN